MTESGTRAAVIDIGSNTVRLLVADISGASAHSVADRSEFVRLGRGVDASGRLAADRIDAALDAIQSLVTMARDLGAESVYLVATSAVRDSSNREEFAALVHDRTGMGLEILSGDEEARVTCLGALTGLDRSGSVVVCDLGGGSAEVIASVDGSLLWSHSFQMGSGRLTERFVKSDPPASGEVDAVRVAVTAQLSTKPHIHADRAVLTGGTATAMCVLLGTSGETVELRPDNVRNALNLALGGPATQVAARFQLSEERASVLPAGVAALLAVVEHFGADVVVVTRHGIREGYLLDRAGHDSIGPTAVS